MRYSNILFNFFSKPIELIKIAILIPPFPWVQILPPRPRVLLFHEKCVRLIIDKFIFLEVINQSCGQRKPNKIIVRRRWRVSPRNSLNLPRLFLNLKVLFVKNISELIKLVGVEKLLYLLSGRLRAWFCPNNLNNLRNLVGGNLRPATFSLLLLRRCYFSYFRLRSV